ncbi:hypothetical protein P389DRAFT_135134, partial [Cystobasidium minutum MCA 4210]|uniref:uncharacterized protein n=1 Tax=Cystobasidium minutum MCA 4210 TaxID=1397322 RepID=UPI0034CE13DE
NPGNNVHVRGLHPRTTQEDLEDIFGKFGTLEKVQIMKDPRTQEPRGFAFVTFAEVDPAQEAIQALNGTNLDGRSIIVEK